MSMNHSNKWKASDEGGLCWVSDPAQAYVEARVKSVRKGFIKAGASDGREFDIDLELPLKPPSRTQKEPPRRVLPRLVLREPNGVENMDNLEVLHEASILENIERRFRMDLIYTNTGPILIAMNPFKWLPIYGEDVISRFHGKPYGSMPPHVFQEAEDAFNQLQLHRKNQAIVICGESGAGKTESTKLMLHYLATVSKKASDRHQKHKKLQQQKDSQQHHQQSSSSSSSHGPTIAERMVDTNPLLEAYGNAKTLRNDNSSRFGKFTRFDFGVNSPVITGGFVENFLLEKVRVCEQGAGERNYHVFYQLLAAAKRGSPLVADAGTFLKDKPSARRYTAGCATIENVDDGEEFDATVNAMKALFGGQSGGQSGGQQSDNNKDMAKNIFRVTAAVFRLGDVDFESFKHPDHHDAARVANVDVLRDAASLLGLRKATNDLAEALCVRVRDVGGERVVSRNEPVHAASLRDALAKAIYSRLFDWIVHRANMAFDRSAGSKTQFIGVLDIYGFEIMTSNGFEQVFINTTNEQLQKVFNDIIFESEAEEYAREQIDWDKTSFPDNTPCIDLLTKKPAGILRMLDAECVRGNAASDGAKFAAKLNKEHGRHPYFEVCGPASVWRRFNGDRTRDEDFLVHHFAGPVVYTVSQFIDKNRDALFGHVYDLLAADSTDPIVTDIFPPTNDGGQPNGQNDVDHTTTTRASGGGSGTTKGASKGGGGVASAAAASKQTVANKYLGQLSALVSVLRESSTRFVRCIKTNHDKLPAKLDKPSCLHQLICSGVMAALEVRRAGYPTRLPYREFIREFRAFTPKGQRKYDDRDLADQMMQHPHVVERIGAKKYKLAYRLGVSKIFMQAEILYELQNVKNNMLYPFVRRLQRWWVHLQGSILQRKYKRCAADLAEAQTEASINAVSRVPAVASKLREGEEIKAETWAIVCMGNAGIAVEAISRLRQAADAAKQVVDEAVKRKEEAYRIRATFLAEIDGGNERCSALKTVAHSLYDATDSKSLLGRTADAEEALAGCRTELITVANEWETATFAAEAHQGPRSLQRAGTLNVAKQRASLDKASAEELRREMTTTGPQLTFEEATALRRQRLDAALRMVQEAEAASRAMLEKKRAMDEARAEFQASLDATSETLAALKIEDFIIAGITSVSDAVAAARDAIFFAQRALQSIDPEPVKAAVAAAARAVAAAVAVAEHEAARVAAIATLDHGHRSLREITDIARQEGFVDKHLEALVDDAEKTITDARDACASEDLAVLQAATRAAVDAVNGAGDYLQAEKEKQEAERQARVAGAFAFFRQRDSRGGTPSAIPASTKHPVVRTLTPERLNVVDALGEPTTPNAGAVTRGRAVPRIVFQEKEKKTRGTKTTGGGGSYKEDDDDDDDDKEAPEAEAEEPAVTTKFPPGSPTPGVPVSESSDTTTVKSDHPMTLAAWLEANSLDQYSAQFFELAEHLEDLRHLTEADFADLVKACGMKKLTARRLRTTLLDLGAHLAPPA